MPSVLYPNAQLLSHCSVIAPRFDTLVVDQLTAKIPIAEIETECLKRTVVTNADKPTISIVTSSGGGMNLEPVLYTAGLEDLKTTRWMTRASFNGDALNLANVALPQHETQVRLLKSILLQAVGFTLFANPAPIEFPNFDTYSHANPAGGIYVGGPFDLGILSELRELISPFTWDSPLVYVMNVPTFRALDDAARAAGSPVEYRDSPLLGGRAAFYAGFPILLSDFIPLDELGDRTSIYLLRLGRGLDDPDGVEGVRFIVPKGRRGVQVIGPEPSSGTDDVWESTVYWDVGLDPGSRGAGVARAFGIVSPPVIVP
jgi:hypothetical protein